MQAQMFAPASTVPQVDDWLTAGRRLKVAASKLRSSTPGHSPGSVTLKVERAGVPGVDLIAGDVLFAGSIGRTDLPGGNYDTLIRSITLKLFPLGDACRVWPGHGPDTTIGDERRGNPFVGGM
jgi:glyoxylase-like metal-dependent hydrolase (beta-lactamase superfamily II)